MSEAGGGRATPRVKGGAISGLIGQLEERFAQSGLTVGELLYALQGKGHAAIMVILSLPFCFPIQIPGLSTPFGIILFYSGMRIAFAQKPWLPGWLLSRNIPPKTAFALLEGLRKIASPAEKVLHPRLAFLCRNLWLHRLHGVLVALLSVLLALPLPIPFSNLLAAIPILLLSLALLEDDGIFLMAGYLAAIPCAVFFGALYLLGPKAVATLWNWLAHLIS